MEALLIETSPGIINQVWFANQGGKLAVFHHGVPKPQPLSPGMLAVFEAAGYSVACIVRRGYLGSTVTDPAPMIADARVTDAVVRHLGFDSFISLGFSGGGPRALADAAALENCTAAIAFGSVAPVDQGFDAIGEMGEEDREFVGMIQQAQMQLLPQFEQWKQGFIDTPFEKTLPSEDPAVAAWLQTPDARFRCELPTDLPFQNGAAGWLLDEISMVSPWGFTPDQISKPTQFITGDADKNVAPSNSKWLASQVASSQLIVVPGYEHNRIFCIEQVTAALKRLV